MNTSKTEIRDHMLHLIEIKRPNTTPKILADAIPGLLQQRANEVLKGDRAFQLHELEPLAKFLGEPITTLLNIQMADGHTCPMCQQRLAERPPKRSRKKIRTSHSIR